MKKILVIEDEAILREEVVEWLRLEGYEAVGAQDGIAGVEYAINNLPDLIVCDITMPRLDGYGVLLRINAHPATVGTPFIFMTARAAHEDMRRGMDLGADDYITKPFSHTELLTAIFTRFEKQSIREQSYQEEIESLQEALAVEHEQRLLKTKLVAMISHDFRNPLANILSTAGLLREYSEQLDEESRRTYFGNIEASVIQLQQMMDDMLVVAQMETDNYEFKPIPLNIHQFIGQIVEEFRAIHNYSRTINFDSNVDGDYMADKRLVRQFTANLISNALKYSERDSEVNILLIEQNDHVVLQVEDHGIGIKEADLIGLFNEFQRGSNVGSISGTGLGLAIVKQAVDLHGGSVQLESEVGVGTTATIMLLLA